MGDSLKDSQEILTNLSPSLWIPIEHTCGDEQKDSLLFFVNVGYS